ncbi:MAG: acyl carrier protein [Patescibacteria group bacterium]|nr:acyl carrier protein [Patescibacteria group bacterium]
METIERTILRLVEENLVAQTGSIEASRTFESLEMDSLDQVELVMAIETELEIEIPDEDAEKWRSLQDVIDYMKGRVPA